jgi:hypothetical protein
MLCYITAWLQSVYATLSHQQPAVHASADTNILNCCLTCGLNCQFLLTLAPLATARRRRCWLQLPSAKKRSVPYVRLMMVAALLLDKQHNVTCRAVVHHA